MHLFRPMATIRSCFGLSLPLLLFLISTCFFASANSQTIVDAYAATNASRFINLITLTPDANRLSYAEFTPVINGESFTTLNVLSAYNFTQLTGPTVEDTFARRAPTRFTIAYPYCASSVQITYEAPGCEGGKLVYALDPMPLNFSMGGTIPYDDTVLNGPTAANQIAGMSYSRSDLGGPFLSTGTLTYLTTAECLADPINSALFGVSIRFNGMFNLGDPTPMQYTDSISGTIQWATTYGLGCTTIPRPVTAPIRNHNPVVIPVCRAAVPFDTGTMFNSTYTEMYGVGFNSPRNLATDVIVYQLRLDNAPPSIYQQYAVRYNSLLVAGGSYDFFPYVSFDEVVYISSQMQPSLGTPNLLVGCYQSSSCVYDGVGGFFYNEADLAYLEYCNCGPASPTVYCEANETISFAPAFFNRTAVPYFSTSSIFIDFPSCGISINSGTGTNSSTPVPNQDFSLIAASFGGLQPLTFNWRFVGTPISAAWIVTDPPTASAVVAKVSAPGIYTAELVVTASNGYSSTCQRQFQVINGVPLPCVTPTTVNVVIAVGENYAIDGSCSLNPIGGPLNYNWTAFSYYNTSIFPFMLGNVGNNAANSILGITPGSGIVFMGISNVVASGSLAIYVTVIPVAPPPGVPYTPFAIPIPPTTNCFVPFIPVSTPFPPPISLPPLGTVPNAPQSPMVINPSGSTPNGGAGIPIYVSPVLIPAFISIVVIIILIAIATAIIMSVIKRRRETGNLVILQKVD